MSYVFFKLFYIFFTSAEIEGKGIDLKAGTAAAEGISPSLFKPPENLY